MKSKRPKTSPAERARRARRSPADPILREPESRHWADLFDLVEGVLAWVKDRQGRYQWVNRAFLIQFALNHPEAASTTATDGNPILGRTDYDLSPTYLADLFRLDDEQVLAGHRILRRIERVGETDGATAWNITSKIPVFNRRGQIVGTAGTTRSLSADEVPAGKRDGFEPILAYMRDHYGGAISNRQLAAVAGMSLRAFERQFLAAFHLTPQKYLRKLRLRIASRALVHTATSLLEVGLSCGFADQSHFTREFRRQFGRTPRDYRTHYSKPAV